MKRANKYVSEVDPVIRIYNEIKSCETEMARLIRFGYDVSPLQRHIKKLRDKLQNYLTKNPIGE